MRLTGGIMCQLITSKRHQTFLHCLVPRHPSFPNAQLYCFCSQDHSPEHLAGGERGGCAGGRNATESHLLKTNGLPCFTLLRARVWGASDSDVLCG